MVESDSDELVCEYDICINHNTNGEQLNLLQYPLRPRYRPYGDQGSL